MSELTEDDISKYVPAELRLGMVWVHETGSLALDRQRDGEYVRIEELAAANRRIEELNNASLMIAEEHEECFSGARAERDEARAECERLRAALSSCADMAPEIGRLTLKSGTLENQLARAVEALREIERIAPDTLTSKPQVVAAQALRDTGANEEGDKK